MFVLKSKYNELKAKHARAESSSTQYFNGWMETTSLANQLNDICQQLQVVVNNKDFVIKQLINKLNDSKSGVTFSQDEIRTLISLCHPDKHNNSDRSNVMTQRLLELRK